LVCCVLAYQLLAGARQREEALMRFALTAIAVSGAVLAVYYALHLAFAAVTHGSQAVIIERYTGGIAALPWGGTNVIAAALIYPHSACVILHHRYGCRWTIPVLALIILAVLLTTSRAGVLFHAIMLVVSSVILCRPHVLDAWASGVLLLLIAYAQHAPDNVDLLLSTRFNAERDLSNGRFDSFGAKWDYISSNLMSPVGYYGSMATFDISSHNVFLTVLVEQGLPGLGCMLLFLGCCAFALFRQRNLCQPDRDTRRLVAAGGLVAFANLLVEDANFTQPYMIYFWMYFTAAMALAARLGSTGAGDAARSGPSHGGGKAWQA